MFFRLEVKTPAKIRITPCPSANKNNIKIARDKFLPMAAKAMIPARIGVEQGVPAKANVTPNNIGYKNIEFVEFVGIDFIIVGNSKSKIPNNFKPSIISKDATIKVK